MGIKVGTFNLFQFCKPPMSWYIKRDKFDKFEWKVKTAWIEKQLKLMDCDIVGFQEVFSIKELKQLCQKVGFKYFETVDLPNYHEENKNIFTSTVLALASKYPIKKIEKIKNEKSILDKFNLDEEFIFSRAPIKAFIQIANKELVTYVFHLKSNRLNEKELSFTKDDCLEYKIKNSIQHIINEEAKAFKQRLIEALILSSDIQNTLKNNHIIALGDLNDKEHCLCIEALTNKALNCIKDFEKSLNIINLKSDYFLSDAYLQALKKDKRVATSYFKEEGNVLDYIFVSKNIKVNTYKLLNKHLLDNKNGSLLESDHAQVVVNISI